jgi:uncharacterized damage-inducible protein DinB
MTMDTEFGDERALLEAHLDENRAYAARKLDGLSWELATRRLGPTPTSAAGIINHLIDVERWWFRHYLLAEEDVPLRSSDDNPDGEFDLTDDDSVESLLAAYAEACQDSRQIASELSLDDRCMRPRRDGTRPSLRWVLLHMIDEVAQHCGHLDIYRELLDGQTERG